MDRVIEMENRRMRLGVTKKQLCALAGIKAEMFSYVLARARNGKSLPEECMGKIDNALVRLESKSA
jgi:hypothetical protein